MKSLVSLNSEWNDRINLAVPLSTITKEISLQRESHEYIYLNYLVTVSSHVNTLYDTFRGGRHVNYLHCSLRQRTINEIFRINLRATHKTWANIKEPIFLGNFVIERYDGKFYVSRSTNLAGVSHTNRSLILLRGENGLSLPASLFSWKFKVRLGFRTSTQRMEKCGDKSEGKEGKDLIKF